MIIIDTETTGLDPRSQTIISIGALDFANPQNQFYGECWIPDSAQVDPRALKVNGFTEDQVHDKTKPSQAELMTSFITWTQTCEDQTLAGMNVWFDRDFLRAAAISAGLDWDPGHRIVDLHGVVYCRLLAQGHIPPRQHHTSHVNSSFIQIYAGLPEEPRPHNALTGAQIEAETFARLIHGHSLLTQYKHYPIPDDLKRK